MPFGSRQMPKRTDIESILIIGAGPIIIGQACEFDYSGAQACKALREEGYRIILVNSNPATIMTDPEMADVTYIEPITWPMIAKIIERERPDALLPTMGGQTALNCALDLAREGMLTKFDVELIGATKKAIDKAEDREKFKAAMTRIGLGSARSGIAHNLDQALAVQQDIGFPAVIRPSFTLGGTGGGIAYNKDEFVEMCKRGLALSPTHELLIEESLLGLERVRDGGRARPQGQLHHRLLDREPRPDGRAHGRLDHRRAGADADRQGIPDHARRVDRRAARSRRGHRRLERAVRDQPRRRPHDRHRDEPARLAQLGAGVEGHRLSRSPRSRPSSRSATRWTSCANDITGRPDEPMPASFEPTIDYVVTKVPRFAFEKFKQADDRLTTQMKSVGEVMAIGRTFQESLQKALRGLETGVDGFNLKTVDPDKIGDELAYPRAERLWYVADAFGVGMSIEEIHRLHEDRSVVPRADQGDRRRRAAAGAAHARRSCRATTCAR